MSEELQQKYLQLQMYEQQTSQVQKHIEQMDQQAAELAQVSENLREIKDVKEGTEILVPMAGGVFLRAMLSKPDHVLVNVGASTTVQKTISDAVTMVEDQLREIMDYRERTAAQLMVMVKNAKKVHDELRKLAQKE